MQVVVTGASGFIGSHLVDSLLDAGFNVRAVARRYLCFPRLFFPERPFPDPAFPKGIVGPV